MSTSERPAASRPSAPFARVSRPSVAAQVGRLAGAIGLVLLASAPLTYLLADAGPLLGFKLIAGTVCLLGYLASNRDVLKSSRGARSNTLLVLSSVMTLTVLLAVGGLNWLVANHDREFDCTREKIFTLSPQTTEALARLDTPVDVYAFYSSQEPTFAATEEILGRYAAHAKALNVHMVDPQSRPDLIKRYNITERGARIVLTAGGRDARAKMASEDELTGALLKVVESSSKTVTFLTGHGEGDTEQGEEAEGFALLSQAIAADGYKVDTLNLQSMAPEAGSDAPGQLGQAQEKPATLDVPRAVDVLVVLAPMHALLQPELQALDRFLERGGRLMVLEEARSQTGLKGLLHDWHVELEEDMVVDTNPIGRLLGLGVASPIIHPLDNGHAILRGINGAIMSTARSLKEAGGAKANVTVTPLMETSETAWGETALQQGSTIARDDQDHLPPLSTALAVERAGSEAAGEQPAVARARLVVFGDSDWASNRLLRLQSNEDLALNALGWLTEQEAKVTVRPNARAQSQLYLTGEQLGALKFLSMDIVPVLLVAFGLGIVLLRRQR